MVGGSLRRIERVPDFSNDVTWGFGRGNAILILILVWRDVFSPAKVEGFCLPTTMRPHVAIGPLPVPVHSLGGISGRIFNEGILDELLK